MAEEKEKEREFGVDTIKQLVEEKKKAAKGRGITFKPYTEDVRTRTAMVEGKRQKIITEPASERLVAKARSVGKLLARERLALLFDEGTFNEYAIWAESQYKVMGMEKRKTPTDATICGFGKINGRTVGAWVTDYTVMAGSMGEGSTIKMANTLRMAAQWRVPAVFLIDSAGGRMEEATPCLRGVCEFYYYQSIYSGVIPQISLICGGCAAGQAYCPALTDFILFSRKGGNMWLGGPRATMGVTTAEDISEIGTGDYHMKYSGEADYVVDSDEEAIEAIKKLLSYLPSNCDEKPPYIPPTDDPNRREERLLDILPADPRRTYDMHEIIDLVVDKGSFFEIKEGWAQSTIVGFCRFNGQVCGIVAGNPSYIAGCLSPDTCDKEVRFLTTCESFNVPVVFLIDHPALLVGDEWEKKGIIRHGTKLLHTTNCLTVPKVTVLVRKAYGGAIPFYHYAPYATDICFAWPTAEMGIMGPDPAMSIIYDKQIKELPTSEERLAFAEEKKKEYFNAYVDVLTSADNMKFDQFYDIIDPRNTRPIIISFLEFLKNKKVERPKRRVNMGNRPV